MKGNLTKEIFKGRNIVIYTPPSYKDKKEKYPVVYFHDGGTLFNVDNTIEVIENMFSTNELKECVMVGIESNDRLDEYTPWCAKALSQRFKDFGGKGEEYLYFIVNELKLHIESQYFVCDEAKNIAMIGYSLGGLISLYAAYLYPKVFGKIGALSPSLWYEGFIEFMKCNEIDLKDTKVYIDVGSNEDKGKENAQRFMIRNIQLAYNILKDKGGNSNNLKLFIEKDSTHNKEAFIRRFPLVLKWLLE